MPNHYDTCRESYCVVCGQTLNNKTGECLDRCTEPGGSHYIPPKQKKKDIKKLNKIINKLKTFSRIK